MFVFVATICSPRTHLNAASWEPEVNVGTELIEEWEASLEAEAELDAEEERELAEQDEMDTA